MQLHIMRHCWSSHAFKAFIEQVDTLICVTLTDTHHFRCRWWHWFYVLFTKHNVVTGGSAATFSVVDMAGTPAQGFAHCRQPPSGSGYRSWWTSGWFLTVLEMNGLGMVSDGLEMLFDGLGMVYKAI